MGDIEHLYDESGDVWSRFGISSQPAWIFINDDGEINTQIGALGVDGMLAALSTLEGS